MLYTVFLASKGISTDTRTISEGQLFFALQGDNFDGNQYAEMAIEKGAVAAVVSSKNSVGDKYVYVEDTLSALQQLAKYHRDQFDIPIIGLTGSNGKTTTKELLFRVLSTKYSVLATTGNLNNHIGVPLTLLRLERSHEVAIIEMGANHLNEIDSYCQIARPTHGIITNIGLAHIGEFGGKQNIFNAKTELFNYVLKYDGIIFFDEKEDELTKYRSLPNSVTSSATSTEFSVACIKESPNIEFKVALGVEKVFEGHSILGGEYNFQNICLTLTVGHSFNCSIKNMLQAIKEYVPSNKRSQVIETNRNTIYLDAYNANPSSMKLAIDYFMGLDKKNKCLILGDMKELGKYSEEEHRKIYTFLQENQSKYNKCYYVGDEFQKLTLINTFKNTQELVSTGILKDIQGSIIFIKGSRSICLERLVDEL